MEKTSSKEKVACGNVNKNFCFEVMEFGFDWKMVFGGWELIRCEEIAHVRQYVLEALKNYQKQTTRQNSVVKKARQNGIFQGFFRI